MRVIDFYERILGLEEPWRVDEVEMNVDDKRVAIHLAHEAGVAWSCPQCGRALSGHDHVPQRNWRHLQNILTYCKHRITNGVAEGLNSKIMSIKRKARGHRNKQNFKTAIYFFCGGLNLYPQCFRKNHISKANAGAKPDQEFCCVLGGAFRFGYVEGLSESEYTSNSGVVPKNADESNAWFVEGFHWKKGKDNDAN